MAFVEFKQLTKEKDEIKLYKFGRVMTSDEAHCNSVFFSYFLSIFEGLWPDLKVIRLIQQFVEWDISFRKTVN